MAARRKSPANAPMPDTPSEQPAGTAASTARLLDWPTEPRALRCKLLGHDAWHPKTLVAVQACGEAYLATTSRDPWLPKLPVDPPPKAWREFQQRHGHSNDAETVAFIDELYRKAMQVLAKKWADSRMGGK